MNPDPSLIKVATQFFQAMGTAAVQKGSGQMIEVQEVELSRIQVPDYQRSFRPAWARKIAQSWDWNVYDPILLTPVGKGRFEVVAGQHRHAAAIARGFASLPARVVKMQQTEAAETFLRTLTSSLRGTPTDRHVAALASGEPVAESIEATAAQFGLRVGGASDLQCVATLYNIANEDAGYKGGLHLLGKTLSLITSTWPDAPNRFESRFLGGVARFLAAHPDERLPKLSAKLGKKMPMGYIALGASVGKGVIGVQEALRLEWMKGKRKVA